jgi:hypothetical protein
MTDLLTLEVHDLHVNVLTGIYSQETHLPQPLQPIIHGLRKSAVFRADHGIERHEIARRFALEILIGQGCAESRFQPRHTGRRHIGRADNAAARAMHQVKAQFAEGWHISGFRLTRYRRLGQHPHLALTRQLQSVIHIDRRDIHIAAEQLRNKRRGAGEGHLDHGLQSGQFLKMQHE